MVSHSPVHHHPPHAFTNTPPHILIYSPVCGASKNQFVEYNEDEGLPPVPETIN